MGVSAQVFSDGTLIQSFSATDINNEFFSSTIATNNGQHLIIDFSATWCTNCWNYHGTKVLEDYNGLYGPNGSAAKDAVVLFYESDATTNSNDLTGVGTNTVGDWVTGTTYRIFNESNPTIVKSSFSGNGSLNYPTVFVVCSDKKMYRLATNIVTPAAVRSFVHTKCGLTPLSSNTVHASSFAYTIYPNPTSANLSISLSLDKPSSINYTLFNSLGQSIISNKIDQQVGEATLTLETSNLPSGMYILNLSVAGEKITEKIIVE